jgi:hypothetical protein
MISLHSRSRSAPGLPVQLHRLKAIRVRPIEVDIGLSRPFDMAQGCQGTAPPTLRDNVRKCFDRLSGDAWSWPFAPKRWSRPSRSVPTSSSLESPLKVETHFRLSFHIVGRASRPTGGSLWWTQKTQAPRQIAGEARPTRWNRGSGASKPPQSPEFCQNLRNVQNGRMAFRH